MAMAMIIGSEMLLIWCWWRSPSLWAVWGGSWSHKSDIADDDDKDDDEDVDDGEVVVDDDAHQACELCEEVAEVIGGMESEPRHAVAEDQPGAQHQLGKILNIIQVWNKKCEMRNIFL